MNPIPETSLIPIIQDNFLSEVLEKGNNNEFSVGAEIRSQYGIPDLVFYNFNSNVVDERIKKGIEPVLSKEIIKTLLLISGKKKISLSFLQQNLPFNKDVVENKIVRYLIKNNYLNKSINDCEHYWVGENTYQTCMNDMFSVEAKISNWKRGFYQAYRYKWFSHYSFLALHEDYINPALKNLHLFQQYNIGLLSVNTETKGIKSFFKPKKEKPYSMEFAALTFEKLFANYCEKKATSQFAESSRLII